MQHKDGSLRMQRWTRWVLSIGVFSAVWIAGIGIGRPQSRAKQLTSDQTFKNVQVLKGIPLDDFIGTMGVMCAALGFDCSDCHEGAGTERVNWAAETPKKLIARRMVTMMATINKDNFNNRQMVTCWSCHHGRD